MKRTTASVIVTQLEDIIAAGHTVSIEVCCPKVFSHLAYEVSVFYQPGNPRDHAHFNGATLAEAMNRAAMADSKGEP